MNLQTLTEHAVNSEIRELELLSLEGGFYLVRIRLDDGLFTLFDDRASRCTCVRLPNCVTCCRPYGHFLACWCSNARTTKCVAGIQVLSKRCAFLFRSRNSKLPLKQLDDLDNDLAQSAPRQVFISSACLCKWVDLVDDGFDWVLVEKGVHTVE